MVIAIYGIAEEGIDADVALTGPERVGNIAVGDVRRSMNLIAFIGAIGPENVVDKNSSKGTTL